MIEVIATISNPGIEKAKNLFYVKYFNPESRFLGKIRPASFVAIKVFAETENGAVIIAKKSQPKGTDFKAFVPKVIVGNDFIGTKVKD